MDARQHDAIRARIEALRRWIYSRDGAGDAAAAEEFATLSQQLEDAAAHDTAERSGIGLERTATDTLGASTGDAHAESRSDTRDAPFEGPAGHRFQGRSLAVLLGATALAGLGIGVMLGTLAPASGDDAEAIPPASSAASTALAVFEAPQRATDIAPVDLPSRIQSDSTRSLISSTAFGLDSQTPIALDSVYAALSSGHQPCLVVVTQLGDLSIACVSQAEFAQYGLRLQWSSITELPTDDGPPSMTRNLHSVEWRGDGEITMGSESFEPRYARYLESLG